jgi:hypothetical protein
MDVNVLFQDVDLVWFKDPFPYFHDFNKNKNNVSTEIDGFFSDDGQRSLRYVIYMMIMMIMIMMMIARD